MSNDVTLVFGNMTPMIEIPSNIVLRQLEEGMMCYVCITLMHTYVQLQLCTFTYTYGKYMYSSWYFLLKCIICDQVCNSKSHLYIQFYEFENT